MITTKRAAFAALIAVGLLSMAACAPSPLDTDDSGSIALVEEFFTDLEAGRASDAAARTDMDFGEEFVKDDFYRASAALPSDARIIETSGYDSGGFTATVEYSLEGVDEAAVLEVRVSNQDGELKISGWDRDSAESIGPFPAAGTVTVNGQLEYVLAEEGNRLTLLPGAYAVEYDDPTGLLRLAGGDSSFTAYVPEIVNADGEIIASGFHIVPTFLPDVEPGFYAEVEKLQAACAEEHFTGPSCPAEFADAFDEPLDASVSAEWFREPGPEIRLLDDGYEATSSYKVKFSNDVVPVLTVSYAGSIARDSGGGITFTPR